MARDVISHRTPRRKRGSWRGYIARRLGALAVTVAALAAANWFTPLLRTSSIDPYPAPRIVAAPAPASEPEPILLEADVSLDLAGPPAAVTRPRPRRTARGVPLNASAHPHDSGYEILSAAELDAISQARN